METDDKNTSVPSLPQRRWLRLFVGPALLGLTIGVVWIDLILMTALVWGPLLLVWEAWRLRRHRFFPDVPLRLTVVIFVVFLIGLAPVKEVDQRVAQIVGPFPAEEMTTTQLREFLWNSENIHFFFDPRGPDNLVKVGTSPLPVQALIRVVEQQTGLRHEIGMCGASTSILRGPHFARVVFAPAG